MRAFFILLGVLIILVVAAAIFLWSGRYNVAATAPHWDITVQVLDEVRERSIGFHSRGIRPRPLNDSGLIREGFHEYHAMCRLCHGAPTQSPSDIARGLNPKPPNLAAEDSQGLSDSELYWIVKNGIKMTGMPAFGPSHDEDELWAIVAFIRHLPKLRRGEYEALAKAPGGHEEEEHHHGSKSR